MLTNNIGLGSSHFILRKGFGIIYFNINIINGNLDTN